MTSCMLPRNGSKLKNTSRLPSAWLHRQSVAFNPSGKASPWRLPVSTWGR